MANPNPKTSQLIPVTQLDEETRKQRASKAGKKSVIAKRKNKAIKLSPSRYSPLGRRKWKASSL